MNHYLPNGEHASDVDTSMPCRRCAWHGECDWRLSDCEADYRVHQADLAHTSGDED